MNRFAHSDAIDRKSGTVMRMMTITPQMAHELVSAADKQGVNFRGRDRRHFNRMVIDMQSGRWDVNGETIKFNKSGVLIDGQHRLMACVKAGKSFDTWACFNVNPSSRMDKNLKRTVAQELKAMGYTETLSLASVLVMLAMYDSGQIASTKDQACINDHQCFDALNRHKAVVQSVRIACRRKAGGIRVWVTPTALIGTLAIEADLAEVYEDFAWRLSSGVDLGPRHPCLHLRNRILSEVGATSKKSDDWTRRALVTKAWNAFVQDEPMGVLRIAMNEDYPNIVLAGAVGSKSEK